MRLVISGTLASGKSTLVSDFVLRHQDQTAGNLIAERGPIDFLAYLLALDELNRATSSRELIEQPIEITREAMRHVDLLVVLPLDASVGISTSADEHLPLREVMNDVLLDLVADDEIVGTDSNVVEIAGGRNQRRAALEVLMIPAPPHP